MKLDIVMKELAALGKEQTKKTYMRHGAREPLFGVTTGSLKPLAKKYKNNHELALALYNTGNYDAMYFAGMIVDTSKMVESDFDDWMEKAYCHGISDYVVAITLSETSFAQEVADRFIASGKDLYMSAGWNCYSALLGNRSDDEFDRKKILSMLEVVKKIIHGSPNWTRYAMNSFISAVGISYMPLHEEAQEVAEHVGLVKVDMGETSCKVPLAKSYIEKAVIQNRVGFKRKHVRC